MFQFRQLNFFGLLTQHFRTGLDFIWSEKHQPTGFRLDSIKKANWPNVMAKNQIKLTFHLTREVNYHL